MRETQQVLEEVGRYFTALATAARQAVWAQYGQEAVLLKERTERTEAMQEVAAWLMSEEKV